MCSLLVSQIPAQFFIHICYNCVIESRVNNNLLSQLELWLNDSRFLVGNWTKPTLILWQLNICGMIKVPHFNYKMLLISIKQKTSLWSFFECSVLISSQAKKSRRHWSTCFNNRKQTSFLWTTLFNWVDFMKPFISFIKTCCNQIHSPRDQGRMSALSGPYLPQAIFNKYFIVQMLNIHIHFL